MRVLGAYKIPSIKHIFYIVDYVCNREFPFEGQQHDPEKILQRLDYFGFVLRYKDELSPEEKPFWTMRALLPHEFLKALENYLQNGEIFPNSSSYPERLELLAINMLKTPKHSEDALFTPKHLGIIPDTDLIEVFI